ncbi:hypothetical protein BH09ACT8_BH09ACT8_27110 [soil metagenome]
MFPIDLLEGKHVSELEISEPGWLFAGRLTDLDTGTTWRFVYRSTVLKTSSPKHQRMLDWLDGAAPVGDVQLATDPDMVFGAGEMTLWER